MFYRMTRLHWNEGDYKALLSLAATLRGRIEAIDGLLFAELAETGAGEGMIIAAYRSASDFENGSEEFKAILDQLSPHLTATPHGHEGTVVLSFGSPPS